MIFTRHMYEWLKTCEAEGISLEANFTSGVRMGMGSFNLVSAIINDCINGLINVCVQNGLCFLCYKYWCGVVLQLPCTYSMYVYTHTHTTHTPHHTHTLHTHHTHTHTVPLNHTWSYSQSSGVCRFLRQQRVGHDWAREGSHQWNLQSTNMYCIAPVLPHHAHSHPGYVHIWLWKASL